LGKFPTYRKNLHPQFGQKNLMILLLLIDPNYLMNLLLRFVQRIHSIQRILIHPFVLKIQKNQKNPSYQKIQNFPMFLMIQHPQFVRKNQKNQQHLSVQKILKNQKNQQHQSALKIH
jgi:hypothetical protein